MSHPKLTFFCELPGDELSKLFDGRFVIDDLHDLDASLSLGILDLSEARAKVVQRLNKAGVPVIARLLLPEDDGYWLNINNFKQAAAQYIAFKAWTKQFDLHWAGIGMDIEPDINEMQSASRKQRINPLYAKIFHDYTSKRQVHYAQLAYQALIDLIHADGYKIESYQLPVILEERRAKATVLQRTMGLVNLEVDHEVLMLYSSFLRPHGPAILWNYAPEADSVGVGSTGGGVEIEGIIDIEPLSWEEFSRDLRLCVQIDKPIHIFSLEGCVEQEFLSKLNTFDWAGPVQLPKHSLGIKAARTGFAMVLWSLEHPWIPLLACATFLGLGFLFKQNQKKTNRKGLKKYSNNQAQTNKY